MTQRVTCYDCHYVLYEGTAFNSPEEINKQYANTCPKCGRKLSILPLKIEVKPV